MELPEQLEEAEYPENPQQDQQTILEFVCQVMRMGISTYQRPADTSNRAQQFAFALFLPQNVRKVEEVGKLLLKYREDMYSDAQPADNIHAEIRLPNRIDDLYDSFKRNNHLNVLEYVILYTFIHPRNNCANAIVAALKNRAWFQNQNVTLHVGHTTLGTRLKYSNEKYRSDIREILLAETRKKVVCVW